MCDEEVQKFARQEQNEIYISTQEESEKRSSHETRWGSKLGRNTQIMCDAYCEVVESMPEDA